MIVKSVSIYKPHEVASFEIGAFLIVGEKESRHKVTLISINFFNSVRVDFSSGMTLTFKGFPIVFEK
jgi:sRNA-binding protein